MVEQIGDLAAQDEYQPASLDERFGALAEQDPFTVAAMRQRQAVRPIGGRMGDAPPYQEDPGKSAGIMGGLADIGRNYADYLSTPGGMLWGDPRYRVAAEVPGQWSDRDEARAALTAGTLTGTAMKMGFDAGTGAMPMARPGTLGSGGGFPPRLPPQPPRGMGDIANPGSYLPSPAMTALQQTGERMRPSGELSAPLQSPEQAAGSALDSIRRIFKDDLAGEPASAVQWPEGLRNQAIPSRPMGELAAPANTNVSQAEVIANLPPPLSANERIYQNYVRSLGYTPEQMLRSEPVWSTAADLSASKGISPSEAYAEVVNDMYRRMGANRFMTPQAARLEMARQRGQIVPVETPGGGMGDIADPMRQQGIVRGRSGRPIQTAPMRMGPEIDQAILDAAYRRTMGGVPPGTEPPPLMQAAERQGPKMGDIAAQPTIITPPSGIRAYHSSPYDFDRFDLSKVGTGEGAQTYGHGIYAAESPAVSGQGGEYWKAFAGRFSPAENTAAEFLARAGFDREKAAQTLRNSIANPAEGISEANMKMQQRMRQEALALLESNKIVGPRTYEVNINAQPEQFLDWDKPLSGQPQPVHDLANEMWHGSPSPLLTGQDMYGNMGFKARQDASKALNEAGIPGIKYLDQGSRNLNQPGIALIQRDLEEARIAGNADKVAMYERDLAKLRPTSNYVVFDPAIIDILRKYGIMGAPAAGIGAIAAQDQHAQ